MSSSRLHPTVIWGQRKDFIFLRIMLQSCERPDFLVTEDQMDFKVIGVGLNGRQEYGFRLSFHESLITEKMRVTLSDKEIQFRIRKKEAVMWPKLQMQQEKPHWIRLDFDLMQESSDEGEGDDDNRSSVDKEMMKKTMDELQQQMKQSKKELQRFEKVVKTTITIYLLIYNSIQWSSFFLVLVNIILLALKGNVRNVYEVTGAMMRFCLLFSILEIVNVQLKLVKANTLPTVVQVFGRLLVLYGVIVPTANVQNNRAIAVLFACWSTIEIFRYPFYILGLLGREIHVLTWLRYTAWIPLYPAGLATEATIIYRSLPYITKSKIWSLELPNVLNFAFDFATFLWLYLLLFLVGSSYMLIHMWKQRDKKLKSASAGAVKEGSQKRKKQNRNEYQ